MECMKSSKAQKFPLRRGAIQKEPGAASCSGQSVICANSVDVKKVIISPLSSFSFTSWSKVLFSFGLFVCLVFACFCFYCYLQSGNSVLLSMDRY